ncbi:MFS transporter [Streptomyces sp. NPDC051567]|uniref:MFS transporter n=1 Tax=Streptomyces sp. NPDC051567 TaxID=3365660 RepID=UPI0037B91A4E
METATPAEPATRAGRREWIGLAVLGLPTLLLSLDLSVLYLALPRLSSDLGANGVQQLWITDIYGFLIAGFLVTMGTLGDRIGRKRLLLIGAAAFGVASLVAAYSTSPEMLIAARALMGVAGATLMPSTLALISNMFHDPKQQAVAFSVWMSCFMGGMALGPVIGGFLLQFFWWGAVFLLGVPVMLLLLATGPALLPEYKDPDAGRLDLPSVALSLAAILPFIYGLKEVAKEGPGTVPILIVVAGLVVGYLFVRRQRSLANPLLDLRLFGNRTFRAALSITLLGGIMAGSHLFVNLYLQTVEGLSPLESALWLIPSALLTIASVMSAPILTRWMRPAYAIAGGLVVVSLGYFLISQVDVKGGMPLLVTGLILSAAGIGPMGALGTGLALGAAPPEKAGSAASLSETGGEFGIAMGVATMGMIGTAIYRAGVDDTVGAAGLTDGLADTARESIAGALTVAADLTGPVGGALLSGARDAFTTSLNSIAAISAALALVLAAMAVISLRHVASAGEGGEDAASDEGSAAEATAPSAGSGSGQGDAARVKVAVSD